MQPLASGNYPIPVIQLSLRRPLGAATQTPNDEEVIRITINLYPADRHGLWAE